MSEVVVNGFVITLDIGGFASCDPAEQVRSFEVLCEEVGALRLLRRRGRESYQVLPSGDSAVIVILDLMPTAPGEDGEPVEQRAKADWDTPWEILEAITTLSIKLSTPRTGIRSGLHYLRGLFVLEGALGLPTPTFGGGGFQTAARLVDFAGRGQVVLTTEFIDRLGYCCTEDQEVSELSERFAARAWTLHPPLESRSPMEVAVRSRGRDLMGIRLLLHRHSEVAPRPALQRLQDVHQQLLEELSVLQMRCAEILGADAEPLQTRVTLWLVQRDERGAVEIVTTGYRAAPGEERERRSELIWRLGEGPVGRCVETHAPSWAELPAPPSPGEAPSAAYTEAWASWGVSGAKLASFSKHSAFILAIPVGLGAEPDAAICLDSLNPPHLGVEGAQERERQLDRIGLLLTRHYAESLAALISLRYR